MLRALLLEDSPRDVEILRELLIDAEFDLTMDCTAAEKEFISLLRSRTYDIIFADFKLPGFDGFAALRWSMEICPRTPFICVSGTIGEETAVELLKQGAVDYVLKDRLAKLPSAIKRALGEVKEKEAHRQAEAALRESEEKYRVLAESSPEMIYMIGRDGHVLYMNNAAASQFHAKPFDLIGKHLTEIFPPHFAHQNLEGIQKVIDSNKGSVRELVQQFPSGEKWIDTRLSPIIDASGEVLAVLGLSSDITARKRVEEALRESEERFRMVFENVIDGISIYSEDPDPLKRRLIDCNEQYATIAGRSREELLKLGFMRALQLPAVDAEKTNEVWSIDRRTPLRGSFSWIRPDGRNNVVEYTGVPITWRGKPHTIGINRDVTERRLAEKQLNLLGHTVKSIGECVSVTDTNDKILFVNDAFLRTYRYAEHEILGKNISILRSPNNAPELVGTIYDAARNEGWHGEMLNRAKDGHEFPISLSTSLVRDENGSAVALVGVASDITERKLAEQALQKSEEKFRRVIETALEGVWFIDSEFKTTEVNDAVVRMLGYAPEELIGRPFIDLVVDDERSMQAEEFQRRKRGISGQYDRRLRCKDGVEKWFLFSAKATMDNQGAFVGSFAMITDITERKRADDAVRESEERFRMVFENVFDGVSIYIEDPDPAKRRLVECNNQYAVMAGRTREELLKLGNTLGLQITLTDKVNDTRSESRSPGSGYLGSFSWIRPDGKDNIIEYTGMPIIWRGKLHSISIDRDITKRKLAEESLIYERNLLKALMDNLPDHVYFKDKESRFLRISKSQANAFGLDDPAQAVGKTDFDFFGEEHARPAFEDEQKIMKSGTAMVDLEEKESWPDGRQTWVSTTKIPFRDAQGEIVGTFGISRDITERKLGEHALQKSEEKFRRVIETALEGVWFLNSEFETTEVNDAMVRMLGYTPEELIGKRLNDLEIHEDRSTQMEELQQHKRGISGQYERKLRCKDGTEKWFFFSGKAVTNNQGEFVGSFAMITDITERKHAEEERQRLITAFEQTAEAILVTDPRGSIQYVNSAFERITGYPRSEVIGQNPRLLKSARQNVGFYKDLWKTISAGGRWSGRFINKKKDGTLFTDETTISPVLNEKGEIINYVGVKRDITSELSLQTQLTQAQKLEGIGTLASGIAHDFNNILGIIMGHTSLLERLREDSKMYSESVAAIMKATQRGTLLVKQIMLFARKTEPLLESVKINNIIVEITKLLQETFPKTITISTTLQPDLPMIVADSSQIHQVLLNLLVNARDAMPNSGTLSISTMTVEGDGVRTRFSKAAARRYVKLEVADTGIGMDESTRQRIFEPFFTTKGVGKGTGLGLAVVFGIVEHHNGFIDVQSALGEGTSFVVYLPIAERGAEEVPVAKKSLEEIPGGTETILVIEDEEVLRTLAKSILVAKGYTVLTAEDGKQGVELYRSHQKEIAVVLSDIGLPFFSGHDVFRKIRAINPEAKIIFASGFFDPETKSEMFKAGLKNFIQKPYMQDEVLQKIREAIDTQ
jgi:PAS domain S-box-containing protein